MRCKLLHREQINKVLLYNTGKYIQYPMINHIGKEYFSHIYFIYDVQLFATSWTVAHQAPLSMEFSRQEYWSRLPFPPPRDLPNRGIEPMSLASSPLQGDSLPLHHLRSPLVSADTYKLFYFNMFLLLSLYLLVLRLSHIQLVMIPLILFLCLS